MRSISRSPAPSSTGPQPSGAAGRPVDTGSVDGETAERPDRLPPETRSGRSRPRRRWVVAGLLVALLAVGGVSANALRPTRKADVRSGTTLVTAEGLAARYGIDVTLIAVTAHGGLIAFRYQVVDPDKANPMIHDLSLFPKLIVEDTGATLVMRSLPHNHKAQLELGGTYFFLLPNANNALHKDARVTLVIGDVRLEHIAVRG